MSEEKTELTLRDQIVQELHEKQQAKLKEADAVLDNMLADAKWNMEYHEKRMLEEQNRFIELQHLIEEKNENK